MRIDSNILIKRLQELENKKRQQGLNEYADGVQQSINEIVKELDKYELDSEQKYLFDDLENEFQRLITTYKLDESEEVLKDLKLSQIYLIKETLDELKEIIQKEL